MKRQLTTFVLLGASLCPGSEALDRALRPPLGGQTTHPFIYSLTPSLSRKGRQLRPSSWEGSGAVLRAGDREVAGPAGAAQGSGVVPSSHFSVYIQDRRASGVGDVRPPNVPWCFFLCPLRALGRWTEGPGPRVWGGQGGGSSLGQHSAGGAASAQSTVAITCDSNDPVENGA